MDADKFMRVFNAIDENLPDAIQCGLQLYQERDRLNQPSESDASRRLATAQVRADKLIKNAEEKAERRLADAEEKLAGAGTTGEAFGGMDMAEFEKRWNEELDAIREECDRRIAKIEEDYNEKLERANASRTVKIAAETVIVNVMPRDQADLS